ncbi:MAG: tyrosine-type recombinase/integrase [Verrucomicrobiaceae bacterium]|nr:tyrosine-type recombinase/integrase [Verrucomicrobiaceae bacterium]
MASLRKFPGSKNWFACFTLPSGKRVQRSTKETLRKPAQAKADEWERLSREHAKARQAHAVIADIYKATHDKELPSATLKTFFDSWLARKKNEIAATSYAAYEGVTKLFLETFPESHEMALPALDTKHFVVFRDRQAKRVSATTVNKFIKLLRVIFEDARRDGYISDNPAKDCPRIKQITSDARRPFTVAELQSIMSVASDEWRSMVRFGLYTGQRLADLAKLTWANIDTDAQEVRIRTGKTGRIVRIPICQPLLHHIESLQAGEVPNQPIHPRLFELINDGKRSMISRQFGDILASVGLASSRSHVAQKDGRSSRRVTSELSFHCLRHTATSMMKNAGISPAVVQDIIGHDSAEISAHYTHIESDAKRRALESLPAV